MVVIVVLGYILNKKNIKKILYPRMSVAAEIYRSNWENAGIIVCGGMTQNIGITESDFMKKILVNAYKINPERIRKENESKNTIEQAINLKLDTISHQIIIVSSFFHLERVKKIMNIIYPNNNFIYIGSNDTLSNVEGKIKLFSERNKLTKLNDDITKILFPKKRNV